MTQPRCIAVVALKRLSAAKSRLTELPPPLRERWVLAMATDALDALSGAMAVIVVSDQPGLQAHLDRHLPADHHRVTVIADGQTGLNPALQLGADRAWAQDAQAVLAAVADVPGVTTTDIETLLAATGDQAGRWYVPDAAGTGTGYLLARGVALDPRFGPDSAARHRESGAAAVELPLRARLDVDTSADLAELTDLGACTTRLTASDGTPATYHPVTVMSDGRMVTDAGIALQPEPDALAGIRHLAPGQRVHAAVDGDRVLSVWW